MRGEGLAIATFWALLILALVLSPLLGLLTPYVSLLFIVPLFFVTLARGEMLAAYETYEARAFLAVFVVIAIICGVTADSVSDALRAFNTAVKKIKEVEECHMIAGRFDYLLKIRTRDIRRYRQVLGERISNLPFVSSTSTNVAMETEKENWSSSAGGIW